MFHTLNSRFHPLDIVHEICHTSALSSIEDQDEKYLFIFLVPPSRLRLSPSPAMPVPDGSQVQFQCTSERAYPTPTFEWFKNDQYIER